MSRAQGVFPYQQIETSLDLNDPFRLINRPVFPVGINGARRSFATKGLLDTGANNTIVPMSYFLEQQIDPTFIGQAGTIRGLAGQKVDVLWGRVDLELCLGNRLFRWGATVGFAQDVKEVILGEMGFLRYFTVTFNGPGRRATVVLSGKLPPAVFAPAQPS